MDLGRWADQVAKGAGTKPEEKEQEVGPLLSTGCTLLNLALAGRTRGVPLQGKYLFIVGDSASGKSWLSIALLAEACRTPGYEEHRLIHDNAENGALMDLEKCFGKTLAGRIGPPASGEFSETIEDFYFNVDDALQGETPFIYVLDSMDVLSSEAEEVRFGKDKSAYRKGKELKGSFGDGKAKKNSQNMRRLVAKLRNTRSVLVVISQTRDDPAAGPFSDPRTRAGGRALKFYAHAEYWTSVGKPIKKEVRGRDRKVGDEVNVKVKKNRFTGRLSTTTIQLYPEYGVDDVGSCIDYLLAEGWWRKDKGTIHCTGTLEGDETRASLIRAAEEDPGVYKALQKEVGRCWRTIEKEMSPDRKPRYS